MNVNNTRVQYLSENTDLINFEKNLLIKSTWLLYLTSIL